MTIPHSDITVRVAELGFDKSMAFSITMRMKVSNLIWIVNDKADSFGFAIKSITMKELKEVGFWPN